VRFDIKVHSNHRSSVDDYSVGYDNLWDRMSADAQVRMSQGWNPHSELYVGRVYPEFDKVVFSMMRPMKIASYQIKPQTEIADDFNWQDHKPHIPIGRVVRVYERYGIVSKLHRELGLDA
jgi:hypothetical protein